MLEFIKHLDHQLFIILNTLCSSPIMDSVCLWATDGGNWIVPLCIAAAFFIYKKKCQALWIIGFALLTVAISDPLTARIIKPLVGRPRPCNPSYFVNGEHLFLAGAHFLDGFRTSFSFPSSHAANSMAQALFFTRLFPRCGFVMIPIALFIGFTRIYIGVHYPLDVATGAFIGAGIGFFTAYLYKKSSERFTLLKVSGKNRT